MRRRAETPHMNISHRAALVAAAAVTLLSACAGDDPPLAVTTPADVAKFVADITRSGEAAFVSVSADHLERRVAVSLMLGGMDEDEATDYASDASRAQRRQTIAAKLRTHRCR